MARGRDAHQARVAATAALGRTLSRRARNRCELCNSKTSLAVVEIAPLPEEPDPEQAVIVCSRCAALLSGRREEPATLRFLEETIWAEIAIVQIAVVRLVRGLAAERIDWAERVLEGLYLDPEVEERV
ncbi:MAG: phnA protein [Myxococcota bacterium]|nr:phnA protein [Myxococcota bacterium]